MAHQIINVTRDIKATARGRLKISNLNRVYLDPGSLSGKVFGRGVAWLATGTHEAQLNASNFVETLEMLEKRQLVKIACPEENSFRLGYVDAAGLAAFAAPMAKRNSGQYLQEIVREQGNSYFGNSYTRVFVANTNADSTAQFIPCIRLWLPGSRHH